MSRVYRVALINFPQNKNASAGRAGCLRATQLTQWSQEDDETVTDTVEIDDGRTLER